MRYTGISFVYQFSGIFASGLDADHRHGAAAYGGGQPWLICVYVLVVSMISAVSVYAMKETYSRDMTLDTTEAVTDDAPALRRRT